MEKVFCIIPARYGSTRTHGKLLRKILDKPLIEWVWLNVSRMVFFDRVFIATDSEEIEKAAKGFGGKVIKTSSSHKCGTDRVAEAAKILNIEKESIIVNIQADEPLISSLAIENLISCLHKSKEIDIATLAHESSDIKNFENTNIVKVVVDEDNFALYFSRSPIPNYRDGITGDFNFLKHFGVYSYRMDFLQKIAGLPVSSLEEKEKLEQLRVLENGYKIKVIISESDAESVNTEGDFKTVEKLLGRRLENS
ncbi:MAG: 3-deoxy-manno-octulosonate cytidylyltransferase [Candidatus Ratteibacteria bacterium]|nr:3-deoxy-manno-octulosonate cytidylyltransferase [Candidatus Ratteibacteria bacterium]